MRQAFIALLFLGCGQVNTAERVLKVTTSGGGAGHVTSPDGIDCGQACEVPIVFGTAVTLTSSAEASSVFEGWSGAICSANGTDCTLTVYDDMTVDAKFDLINIPLTVMKSGNGIATITSTPPGIDCGSTCTAAFPYGTSVTLNVTPTSDSTFMGWTGGCSGTGSCTTTIASAQTVGAMTACNGGGMATFDYTGALQMFNVPSCVTTVTIDASGAQGGGPSPGGLGAHLVGTFPVVGGQSLTVLVGGQGGTGNGAGNGGGGGGSFVYNSATDTVPLVAAGGGGGLSNLVGCNGGPGSDTTTPTLGVSGSGNAAGGSGGNGGAGGAGTDGGAAIPGTGGGGAGWVGNGAVGTLATAAGGGLSPRNGATGGTAGTQYGAAGGFGGGGGSSGNAGASGGGGGYNGGGGGNIWSGATWGCGGGGGSYNGGATQANTAAVRAGNGQVIITW